MLFATSCGKHSTTVQAFKRKCVRDDCVPTYLLLNFYTNELKQIKTGGKHFIKLCSRLKHS